MTLSFDDLRAKWHEVPSTSLGRISSTELLEYSDSQFIDFWESARHEITDGPAGYRDRGWLQDAYRDWMKGRKIIEVGSGLGFDAVTLAEFGVDLTVCDIVASNLEVVKRIFSLKRLPTPQVVHLTTPEVLDSIDNDYDAVFGFGSLHHGPISLVKPEYDALARRLKPRGRFLFFAYPKQRWIDEGEMPFDRWGEKTDGADTPWAEWYDAKKLIARLRPAHFARVSESVFRDGAMICIDLIKIDGVPELAPPSIDPGQSLVLSVRGKEMLNFGRQRNHDTKAETQGNGIIISTPSNCWSYAIDFPMQGLVPGHSMSVRMRALCLIGRVGIGISPLDGDDFLTERYIEPAFESEISVDPEDFMEDIVLHFTPTTEAVCLMVRNAFAANKPSVLRIDQLDIFAG
jgi:SAM-dependent methyltransferase